MVRKLTKVLLLLILGLVLILVGVNAFDEKPEPDVQRMLEPVEDSAPAEENGFFLLMAFSDAGTDDPHSTARERAAAYNRAVVQGIDALADWADTSEVPQLEVVETEDLDCEPSRTRCLEYFARHSDEVLRALRANRILLKRYRQLASYSSYRSPLTPTYSEPIPGFAALRNIQQLHIAAAAIQGTSVLIDTLAADIGLWRRVLADSDRVITKMVAYAMLDWDYRVLAEALEAPGGDEGSREGLARALAPLTRAERSITDILNAEFQAAAHLIHNMRQQPDVFAGPNENFLNSRIAMYFFQPNATLNGLSRFYREVARLADIPGAKLAAASEQLHERHGPDRVWGLGMVYNPVGKILNAIAIPAYHTYIERMHNLEGLIRLLRLKQGIIERGLSPERIPDYIVAQGEAGTGPYDSRPIQYDPANGRLFFAPPRGDPVAIAVPGVSP
jgi:hypothetical protein